MPPGLGKGKKQVVLPAPEVPVPLLCGLELMEALWPCPWELLLTGPGGRWEWQGKATGPGWSWSAGEPLASWEVMSLPAPGWRRGDCGDKSGLER